MKPGWIDPALYPFEPRTLNVEGARLSYLDEGAGAPIVLAHGTPTWSFLWRRLVLDLRRDHRVVAPDHLGFGLSDKPHDADYAPATPGASRRSWRRWGCVTSPSWCTTSADPSGCRTP